MSGDLPSARWLASLGIAALGHGALLAASLSWAASPPTSSGAPVFAVEIAAAPPAPAPAPEAEPTPQPPPPPEAKPEPPKPAVAEVPLPRPKPPTPKAKPQPKPVAEATPSPQPAPVAPPAPEPDDKAATAPASGANAQAMTARATSWQGEVLGRLEQYKRYPRSAQWKRREGAALVSFTIDRGGRLLAKRLNRSSGHDDLDAEALDLLDRAQPLPPPPESVPGERIELVVPIQFYLKR